MAKSVVLVMHWLPDGELARWAKEFPDIDFVDARAPEAFARHAGQAAIAYGLPPADRLKEAASLRWIQLASAGVPWPLCQPARDANIRVTNLAGLYGPSIAEHALGMMLFLARNLHIAHHNQKEGRWDRTVLDTMRDLHGKTLAVVGLGNIGQNIARLAHGFGMRILGNRRRPRPTPLVDRVYSPGETRAMLGEADYVAVAAPLVRQTEGMLGQAEFDALKPGAIYVNVSRGPIAQEAALLAALQSRKIVAAGLDVFAVEPLPAGHPFWTMPNVLVSPHYSGETVNYSRLPAERFVRNLHAWLAGRELEGNVDLEQGY
jgi:phosphoglycerate dehydrogenase-like enzyme